MNREHKYRAWDKKKMSNSFSIWEIGSIKYEAESDPDVKKLLCNKKDVIFLQFTGLLDKNGKEIYEGDILRCYDNSNGYIEWSEKLARYFVKFQYDHPEFNCCSKFTNEKCEVIGNIYENTELLNEKKENRDEK